MPHQATSALAPGQFRRYITSLEGRRIGPFKRAAGLAGLTLDEFIDRLDSGLKRCTRCKLWKAIESFGHEADRWDGRDAKCLECHRKMGRDRYEPVPVDDWKPTGPPRHAPRDGDKKQARQRINVEVRTGRRPAPNSLPCVDCGHVWSPGEKRHEYDHYLGYDATHHYDVEAVCKSCHEKRHTRVSCKRGHPLSGENVGISTNGRRFCLACRRDRERGRRDATYWREYRARKEAVA